MPRNISMMYLPKEDVLLTPNIMVELVELGKPVNLEKQLVDGLRNLSRLFLVLFKILKQTPMQKISRILQLNTSKQTELPKVEEEPTELMVVLVLIFLLNAMSKCGPLRNNRMSERRERTPGKSPKEKFQ